jgi:hypothetical protein
MVQWIEWTLVSQTGVSVLESLPAGNGNVKNLLFRCFRGKTSYRNSRIWDLTLRQSSGTRFCLGSTDLPAMDTLAYTWPICEPVRIPFYTTAYRLDLFRLINSYSPGCGCSGPHQTRKIPGQFTIPLHHITISIVCTWYWVSPLRDIVTHFHSFTSTT